MSFFWVKNHVFGVDWTFWKVLVFIEKWVLDEKFASNFAKNQKFWVWWKIFTLGLEFLIQNLHWLIKSFEFNQKFYTGVGIFDSKFALINSKIWSKSKFCIESLIKTLNFCEIWYCKKRQNSTWKKFLKGKAPSLLGSWNSLIPPYVPSYWHLEPSFPSFACILHVLFRKKLKIFEIGIPDQ